jgi:hypothetical protein
MHRRFPAFIDFQAMDGSVGFCGSWRGPRTARKYTIIVGVPAQRYPEMEPAVYIQPRIATGYWQIDRINGRLSFERPWVPASSTFALCVLVAIQFLEEFDQ